MRAIRTFVLFVMGTLLTIIYGAPTHVSAACDPLPTDKGQASFTVKTETPGQYTLWVRMLMPGGDRDSVFVQIDDQCPVIMGDSQTQTGTDFTWINFKTGDPDNFARFDLTAGPHAIKIAGREAGTGVDKAMLVANAKCTPTDSGDNCFNAATANTPQDTPSQQIAKKVEHAVEAPNWWAVGASLSIVIVALGVMIWKYIEFTRAMPSNQQDQDGTMTGHAVHAKSRIASKFVHFLRQHKIETIVCATTMAVGIVIGIVAASDDRPFFEAEAAALSGSAAVNSNASASGGRYVVFQPEAHADPAAANNNPAEENTGTATCPLPRYPTPSCTGVPAGTAIASTVDGDYHAQTPNQTINKWRIKGNLIIEASGVTVSNSHIDGQVTNAAASDKNFTITDSSIGPSNGCNTGEAISNGRYTATRVYVHNWENGLGATKGPIVIRDSYIKLCSKPGGHSTGIQDGDTGITGGSLSITHNTIDQRSAPQHIAPVNLVGRETKNVALTDNLIMGGSFSLFVKPAQSSWGVVKNNRLVSAAWDFGAADANGQCDKINEWSGNTLVTIDSSYAITQTVGALSCPRN